MTPEELAAQMGITRSTVASRLASAGLTPDARQRLRAASALAESSAHAILDRVYARLRAHPETGALLVSDRQVSYLKAQQRHYLDEVFTSDIDWDYTLRRLTIGINHHRVKLHPQWYLTTYSHLLCEHIDAFFQSAPGHVALDWTITLTRSMFFDAALAMDAYGRSQEADIVREAQHQPSMTTSTPRSYGTSDETERQPGKGRYARINLTRESTSERRDYLGLSDEDIIHLRSLRAFIQQRSEHVVSEFYAHVATVPALAALVPESVAARLHKLVVDYWTEMVDGGFDRPYAASRMRIGVVHEQIGLTIDWYLIGAARQLGGLLEGLDPTHPDTHAHVTALIKAVFFDLSYVIDAYMDARAATLLRTEGYASQLIAGLSAGVAVVDNANRLISANRTLVSLAGGDAAVLYLMPIEKALPFREAAPLIQELRGKAKDSPTPSTTVGRLGERRLRMTAMPLGDAWSGSGTVALVVDDVTDLVRIGNDLDQYSDHFEHLADGLGMVLWELDLLSWTITAINEAVSDLTGYRNVFFLGRPAAWIDRIVESDRVNLVSRASALRPGERCDVEYRFRRADGVETWLRSRLSKSPRSPENLLMGATVDVTALRRSDSLRFDAIATLAGGVAHVVNNCLTGIVGGIQLHVRQSGLRTPAPLLLAAIEAAGRAAATVSQLLTFAGQQPLQSTSVSLSEISRAALPSLRAFLGESMTIQLDLAPDLWPCRADARLLHRTLECLADNSRRAMGWTGVFRIATRNRRGSEIPTSSPSGSSQDWVEWEISDSGEGMSPEVVAQAMNPFFTTRSLADADGLGLSMVQGFVKQCGGHVEISSVPKQSTTVTIRLPRDPDSLTRGAQEDTPLVLLVEDQADIRRVTAVMIDSIGYRVVETGSVEEARHLAATHRPSILVADVVLGQGTDGVSLAVQLSKLDPQLSVILVSGYSKRYLDLSLVPSNCQFLPKPFSMEELEACFRATPHKPR
ncbi:MAG: protoglobin domain-containing protein [Vicinamibacterales bacterium]